MDSCIFCDILNGKRIGHLIYADKKHIAFLDKYPIDHGHSLVIPRNHHRRITDMDSADVGDLFSKIPKIASAILQTTGAVAFSLGQNNGREAKQIVPHVHVHIIPRYKNKATEWTKRRITPDSDLLELAAKIKESFDNTTNI